MVCRNIRRRTLLWPIAPGHLAPIAAGGLLEVHGGELAQDATLRAVLRALLREGYLAIEADGLPPILH